QVLLNADHRAAGGSVDHLHAHEPSLRPARSRRPSRPRPGGQHRVQEWQGHGHAHALEDGAAGNVLLRDVHVAPYFSFCASAVVTTASALLIWNAALLTIPTTNDEKRLSFCAAFFTIARTVGPS